MKQCISKFIRWINYLWRTLKEYVCKRVKISRKDNSGIKIHIDTEIVDVTIESGKEETEHDS